MNGKPERAFPAGHQEMYSTSLAATGGALAASQTAPRSGTNLPFQAADHSAKGRTEKRRD